MKLVAIIFLFTVLNIIPIWTISALHANSPLEIEIKTESNKLISLQREMRNISRSYHRTLMKKPYLSSANYLEKAKCGGVYCMFTEAEGFLFSDGYDTMIETGNFVFVPKVLYKSDRKQSWLDYMHYTQTQKSGASYQSDKQMNAGAIFSAFRFFEINGPLSEYRRYEYEKINSSNSSINGISFESENRAGIIYYDVESNLPQSIEIFRTPFYSISHERWVLAKGHIKFKQIDNTLYIQELYFQYQRGDLEYFITVNINDLVTNDIEQMYYRDFSLLSNSSVNPYIEKIHELDRFESFFENVDLQKLRTDLENDKSIELQFMENSDQPFFYKSYPDGRKELGHVGDRAFEFIKQFLRTYSNPIPKEGF